ncbi:threonine-phosphate decarboxylase CobD [Aureimonas sp. AU12]|uniref:threonine-phosphate decarboxylase CobD n=1 Tax=Aureimonas sp. AU12 TaxID=1638161 RepID=UPI00078131AE|nr:threonine-phosphate decarboxylase CobD [Aureimonas sp. AU12]
MREAFRHGGALGAAMRRFGGARADWLDLSTGIHPSPPPLPPIPPVLWHRLPEAEEEEALIDAARRFYGVPAGGAIVAAPGSQSLISLLPHLAPSGPAAVLSPTYGEHARALQAAGHAIVEAADLADIPAETRLVVLAHPNNPDGRRHDRADLLSLAARLAALGGLLVVDEAFMDADPRQSLAGDAGMPGLVVLRSFGKFFGLAGLRLGFALCEPTFAVRIRERLGPWAVSGPALHLGAALMRDAAGVGQLRAAIARNAGWTRDAIRAAGLEPKGDAALFALVETPQAPGLFEGLARRHILVRPFAYRADWLRIGSAASEAEAHRLALALRAALDDKGIDP